MSETTKKKPPPAQPAGEPPENGQADLELGGPPRVSAPRSGSRATAQAYRLPTLVVGALLVVIAANGGFMVWLATRTPAAPATGAGDDSETAKELRTLTATVRRIELQRQAPAGPETQTPAAIEKDVRDVVKQLRSATNDAVVLLAGVTKNLDGLREDAERVRRLLGEPVAPPTVPQDVFLVGLYSAGGLDLLTWQDAILDVFDRRRLWPEKNYRLGLIVVEGGIEKVIIGLKTEDQQATAKELWPKRMTTQNAGGSLDKPNELAPMLAKLYAEAQTKGRKRVVIVAASNCPAPADGQAWGDVTVHAILIAASGKPNPPTHAAEWQHFCAQRQGELICLTVPRDQKDESKLPALKMYLRGLLQP